MFSDISVSIPLGIAIGLLASCVQSLGITFQRKSHVINQSLPDNLQRVEHRRPLWLLGFAVFISSNILGSFVQIASLPVVILAPLGAVSLLWNAFFARFILGDVFSPWMILGTILIAGGAILIGIFGIVPEQTRSLEDLLELFRRPTFIVYFSILGFVLSLSLVITHVAEFSLSRTISETCPSDSSSIDLSATAVNLPGHTTDITAGITVEINDTILATERTSLLDRKSSNRAPSPPGSRPTPDPIASINRTRLILAICYASFSGIISGMCLLFAKSGVELLLLTVRGKNQFWRWEALCLVLGLVAFALLQLWYLHKGLVLADPTIVCPSAFCFYNLSSIVNGLVYFNQFSLIPAVHLVLVSIGIIILLGGVWIVSIQPAGGGIDLGTWDEEIVHLNPADLETVPEYRETDDAIPTAETLPLRQQPAIRCEERQKAVPMNRETMSESNTSNISVGVIGSGRSQTRSSLSPDRLVRSRRAETLYASPRIPSIGYSTFRPDQQLPPSQSHSQLLARAVSNSHASTHQATSSLSFSPTHTHTHGPLSPPLGAALQIGLSPVSPGFAILPLERKRKNAYTSGGFEGVVSPSGSEDVGRRMFWKMQRRRTMSDGEVSRMNRGLVERQAVNTDSENVNTQASHDVHTVRPESEMGSAPTDLHQGGDRHRRTMWRWLRSFITVSKD